MLLPSKLPALLISQIRFEMWWGNFSPRPTCNYRSLKRINPEHELDLTKFRSVKNKLRCQAVLAPLCWLSTAPGRRGNCSWETLTLQPESTCRCLTGFIVRSVACIPVPFICLRMPNPREYTHMCVCVFLWRLKHTKKKIISYEFSKISKKCVLYV